MIPTADPSDHAQPSTTDDCQPRYFLDDAFDAGCADGDWWLDLGCVDLPNVPAV
jgi:hypothetical protein